MAGYGIGKNQDFVPVFDLAFDYAGSFFVHQYELRSGRYGCNLASKSMVECKSENFYQ